MDNHAAIGLCGDELRVTAWCHAQAGHRVIMALEHATRPLFGVQFHPESVCAQYGVEMLENFMQHTVDFYARRRQKRLFVALPDDILDMCVLRGVRLTKQPALQAAAAAAVVTTRPPSPFDIRVYQLPSLLHGVDDLSIYCALFASHPTAVWLDSARPHDASSTHSYMASASHPHGYTLHYTCRDKQVVITSGGGGGGRVVDVCQDGFFSWFNEHMRRYQPYPTHAFSCSDDGDGGGGRYVPLDEIPFKFHGGFVGYFGYEMKQETLPGYVAAGERTEAATHDAMFAFVDRVVVLERVGPSSHRVWLTCMTVSPSSAQEDADSWLRLASVDACHAWFQQMRKRLDSLVSARVMDGRGSSQPAERALLARSATSTSNVTCIDKQAYQQRIQACRSLIKQGETYQLCLTTRHAIHLANERQQQQASNADIYAYIRTKNPAPFSAYLHFSLDFCIFSSSPERFLCVERRGDRVWMKPIKGTVARCTSLCACKDAGCACRVQAAAEDDRRRLWLKHDEKERAENLMIVDLIRHDLTHVCTPSTVHVPKLFHVESFQTVHQLVSTVAGQLAPRMNALDAIEQCFPPGSMTGAPKLRSVQLLEHIEQAPRGVYSGILGWIGADGHACDMSVVIRTLVKHGDAMSIGAGGAITWLSKPKDEWEEMLLKLASLGL